MPDREKVIAGLTMLADRINDDTCEGLKCCKIAEDALALLKEQEAVEPRVSTAEQRCGYCNKVIEMDGWKTCPWCGKRIDWESWWKKNDS